MTNDATEDRWPMLPGPKWETPLQAKTWLIEQRRLLGWSHKDVAKWFLQCACKSDLYIGPGGGERFERPTEKRVARFEREGQHIPDWLYWMPLVIRFSQVPLENMLDWEGENIPENSDFRREREEDEYHAHIFYLDEDEKALIERFREMSADEQATLRLMAEPNMLRWWVASVRRAAERDVNLFEVIEKALNADGGRS